MKPFKVPKWADKIIDRKYARKRRVIKRAVSDMESVMKEAVNQILQSSLVTGVFVEPSMARMYQVSESFYRNVLTQAYASAKDEKHGERRSLLSRMAAPIGLPRSMRDLEKVFRDKRYWPKVMKRSRLMTDRLRDAYLKKLRNKFNEIVPRLHAGEITRKQATDQMMQTWHASKSRVETIFRTETTTYFAKSQVSFFSGDPEIIGFLFDSLKDAARTKWCQSRHGLIYRPGSALLTKNQPPCHWNCRSHLIPLADTPENRKMLADPGRDPSMVHVEPLPKGWRK